MLPFAPSAVSLAVTIVALTPAVAVPVPPFAMGKMPLTCVVRLTPLSVPPRVRLPAVVTVPVSVMPLTVPVPPTDVTVPLPVPAPRLARAAAAEVAPVPPLAITNVPASTTAPLVGLLGVKPVVPALKLVMPLEAKVIVPAPLVTVMPVPAVKVFSE